jgi:Lipoprotein LpqB beta-propeller domain/Sporulation and spore germination
MASAGLGRPRRWLVRAWRTCLLTGLAVSVAGCVGMPNSGSPGTFSATPTDTSQDSDFIGTVPAGPGPNWSPNDIVTGFLNATVSYPAYSAIAEEYLASSVPRNWAPNWSVTVVDQVNVSPVATFSDGGRRAVVDVTGTVQASFNGTGQYVGVQQGRNGTVTTDQRFTLVKEGKQWRITNPPKNRILTEPDFAQVYKPQDLYFLDSTGEVLVPDAVFVPTGTSSASLATNLVRALLNNPQPKWLQGSPTPPAVTAFPPQSTAKNIDVTVDGPTATVNLTGTAARASPADRALMATQLVWTLTGQPGSPPNIQAVQLEFNGKPWTPSSPPCPGVAAQSPPLKQAMYDCKNPYPVATSSSFYYVANGQAWSRCASEAQATTGSVGEVIPVFDRTGAARLDQPCKSQVQASSSAVPPPQAHAPPPLSMVTTSPDGKYLAGVSPNGKTVTVWASGDAKPSSTLPLSGVTAISWDRRDYLWVAQGDTTTMVLPGGNNSNNHNQISNGLPPGKIRGLSIAPDGVRVAAIVQAASGPEVDLAAIDSGKPGSGLSANPLQRTSIGSTVQLGPNIPNPIALTWYDADDLLVLDGAGDQTSLWEVPVDGQPAAKLPGVLPGAISITANSARNALVVGMTRNRMEVSAALEGPWQPLGSGGQNPAFQTPAIPVAAQS